MKKLQTILIFNSIIYWSVYLIKTFIIWEFKNPFQWIIDIPNYTNDNRFGLIVGIIFVILFETMLSFQVLDKNGKFIN